MRVPGGEAGRAAWPGAEKALLQGPPPSMTRSCPSGSSARRCPLGWAMVARQQRLFPALTPQMLSAKLPLEKTCRACYASSKPKCSIITAGTGPCCCGDWLQLSGPVACFGSACSSEVCTRKMVGPSTEMLARGVAMDRGRRSASQGCFSSSADVGRSLGFLYRQASLVYPS